jgi:2-hydroxychromene-2-carboxylate isomerase
MTAMANTLETMQASLESITTRMQTMQESGESLAARLETVERGVFGSPESSSVGDDQPFTGFGS